MGGGVPAEEASSSALVVRVTTGDEVLTTTGTGVGEGVPVGATSSSVLVLVATGDVVLSSVGAGAATELGEGVPAGMEAGTEVGEGVPSDGVGTPAGASVSSGAGAGVPDGTGQASQEEHSPQPRHIWLRSKSAAWPIESREWQYRGNRGGKMAQFQIIRIPLGAECG